MYNLPAALLLAVATFANCNPSPPAPGTGSGGTGGTTTYPAWTVDDVSYNGASDHTTVVDVRHGTHAGFDRVVFEFDGGVPDASIGYVDKPTWQCGSGDEVWLDGDAWLRVDLHGAQAHTDEGYPTLPYRSFRSGYTLLLEGEQVCDYEAEVAWVFGVSSPNGYRVYALTNPDRLVIDLKQ